MRTHVPPVAEAVRDGRFPHDASIRRSRETTSFARSSSIASMVVPTGRAGRGWSIGCVASFVGVAVLLVSTCTSAAASSARVRRLVTRSWAGYLVRSDAAAFTEVRGRWVQPRVVCNRPGSSASFWLGLGGAKSNSTALEQIGTSADCSEGAVVSHSAWYQLFPAPAVELPLTIRPGDAISASVALRGTTVTLVLHNETTGTAFSTDHELRSPEADSAEWVVEAPSMCFRTCEQLPLPDFSRVAFARLSATVGTHTGTIRDAGWVYERIVMASRNRRTTTAVPTRLSGDGSSFDVARHRG
jgi:Peptidase A4 family